MATIYTADGNKLVESKQVAQEEQYTWIQILSYISDLQTELTNHTARIDEQLAIWEVRKAEAIKLGLDTLV